MCSRSLDDGVFPHDPICVLEPIAYTIQDAVEMVKSSVMANIRQGCIREAVLNGIVLCLQREASTVIRGGVPVIQKLFKNKTGLLTQVSL